MSAPANFVIIDDDIAWPRVYFEKYGALGLLPMLYESGPLASIEDIRRFEESYELDDTGHAVLIDTHRRLVLLDAPGGEPAVRRLILRVLSRKWADWTFAWAYHGLDDIQRAGGLPLDSLYSNGAMPIMPLELPLRSGSDALITIVDGATSIHCPLRSFGIEQILIHGPAVLEDLTVSGEVPAEEELNDGAVVDLERKEIEIWWADSKAGDILRVLSDVWPGWSLTCQHEGLRAHLRRVGVLEHTSLMTHDKALVRVSEKLGTVPDLPENASDAPELPAGILTPRLRLTLPRPVLPLVAGCATTVVEFERAVVSSEFLVALLENLGTHGDREGHAAQIMRRITGQLRLSRRAAERGTGARGGLQLAELAADINVPVYEGDGLKWTLDAFNPTNEDCPLTCQEGTSVYLQIVADFEWSPDFEEVARRRAPLYAMLKRVWMRHHPRRLFGSRYGLFSFALHHQFPRVHPSFPHFDDVHWDWQIFSTQRRRQLVLNDDIVELVREDYPACAPVFEDLEDGALLVWSWSRDDHEAVFAHSLGLKDLQADLPMGRIPYWVW